MYLGTRNEDSLAFVVFILGPRTYFQRESWTRDLDPSIIIYEKRLDLVSTDFL